MLHSEILILVYKSLIIPVTTSDKTKVSGIYFAWDLVVQPHYYWSPQTINYHNYACINKMKSSLKNIIIILYDAVTLDLEPLFF